MLAYFQTQSFTLHQQWHLNRDFYWIIQIFLEKLSKTINRVKHHVRMGFWSIFCFKASRWYHITPLKDVQHPRSLTHITRLHLNFCPGIYDRTRQYESCMLLWPVFAKSFWINLLAWQRKLTNDGVGHVLIA